MFNEKEIELLKKELSKSFNNYIERVMFKSELSRPTVSKFFNFQRIKPTNCTKIYDAALELLEEQKLRQRSRVDKAKSLIEPDQVQKRLNP